jgi:hypothetical protein
MTHAKHHSNKKANVYNNVESIVFHLRKNKNNGNKISDLEIFFSNALPHQILLDASACEFEHQPSELPPC